MAEGVLALQPAEVIRGSTFRQAIGIAGGDVQGVQHPEAILQIRNLGGQRLGHSGRQITERSAQAMAPVLLAVVQMQRLEGFFHGLMTGETGPLVMAGTGAELGLGQISLSLMQPIGGAIHAGSLVNKNNGRCCQLPFSTSSTSIQLSINKAQHQ
jgi:hypothetical protein